MRVLVTGAKGQLGTDVMAELKSNNIEAVGIDREELDIVDAKACEEFFDKANAEKRIDAVIHCAAYTAVDKAEDEQELSYNINALGTKNIATACKKFDMKLMYISTDYVFNGQGERPWEPDDERQPLNVYGKTKYEGELFVEEIAKKYFIVRIAWVFGIAGNNFIKTMLKLAKERDSLTVVDDQIGSPTYTADLSKLLVSMIQTDKYGRYHATNEGYCSWYEFAKEIFKVAGVTINVAPVDSSAYPAKAKRPANSRMEKKKLDEAGFKRLPSWQDATRRYIEELQKL
jgi:dTDP-4-dehydrorhamnose reductase